MGSCGVELITTVTNVLGPSHPVASFTAAAYAAYLPGALPLGAEIILPPVAASYQTKDSPVFIVAVAVCATES